MVFSSLLFVFLFLPLNLLAYFLAKNLKQKNIVMLISSLIFYAWGGPRYLILLLVMAFISWIGALLVRKYHNSKFWLIITISLMLGFIVYFKYFAFLLTGIQVVTGFPKSIPEIALPIGISFYTFQLISYVVDVYRGEVEPQRKYWLILLYASLFHQCIAGPIVRYQDIQAEISNRSTSKEELSQGIKRFSVGLAKKAILANGCATIADTFLLTSDMSTLAAVPALGLWLGVFAYMLQIYLDFSAYSDMAIGMGLMIGFHYKENFNYPYIASSITDFWRRWHISLSSFFRDYIYIPLGGNRKGKKRQIFNLFVVWFLTGLWHGASWNYVLWGLYFFVFLVVEKVWLLNIFKKLPKIVSHIYTLIVVFFGWIIFKFESLSAIGITFLGLFGLNGNGFSSLTASLTFKNNLFFIIFAIIACTPLLKMIHKVILRLHQKINMIPYIVYVYDIALPIVLLILSLLALVGNSYNPFLYFQF
ncbi:MAG: MBOAT family protein [Erysipelotrichaceae bacterium]|nr:MBOAT family protein [Erysipelotrichaceae bacterium]